MSAQVLLVFLFTFIIHLISTLSYGLRIAGIRTGRIAVSLALFNILLLVSRTANTFQAPLLASHVEHNILSGVTAHMTSDFRWLLLAATSATLVGILLIPTFQRLFTRAIEVFGTQRSIPRLLLRGLSRSGLRQIMNAGSIPAKRNLTELDLQSAPWRIIIANALATALLTVGVLASLYAGYLQPDLRMTANNLSPVINALSTVLLFVFIDPYLSLLTDDVVNGQVSEARFRKCITLFALSRLAGTVIAQIIFIPAARVIVFVAKLL